METVAPAPSEGEPLPETVAEPRPTLCDAQLEAPPERVPPPEADTLPESLLEGVSVREACSEAEAEAHDEGEAPPGEVLALRDTEAEALEDASDGDW